MPHPSPAQRRPVVAIIGSGEATDAEITAARALGEALVDAGWRIVCGGRGGVMAAVCEGARSSSTWTDGATVGVLPGADASEANAWVDIVLPTGLGFARNVLVVLAAEVVVAVGGGAGTLSELGLAWRHDKRIVALDVGTGWSARLGGTALDDRDREPILAAADVAGVMGLLGES